MLNRVAPLGLNEKMQVAYVSSCLPRKCGIATFTANLSESVGKYTGPDSASYVAVNNNGSYDYRPGVIFEIERDRLEDYFLAASMVNSSAVDVVSLQHEFGLFGGPDGSFLKVFLKHLQKPVVTTLHTILKNPTSSQKETLIDVVEQSEEIVVMNRLGIDLLSEIYNISRSKINLIPHGVPESEYRDPSYYKRQLQLEDRFLILTFGFISPNKGIETVLNALPLLVKKHPNTLYMVQGITHPEEKKHNGENYRNNLEQIVRKLDLSRNVIFVDAFVDDETLNCFVGAADIVVFPYHSEAQITSGVLSTALSKGKAIISTPYLHAIEALTEGRGVLVKAGDPVAMAAELLMLAKKPLRRKAFAEKAYSFGRHMGWSNVSSQYFKIFEGLTGTGYKEITMRPESAYSLKSNYALTNSSCSL